MGQWRPIEATEGTPGSLTGARVGSSAPMRTPKAKAESDFEKSVKAPERRSVRTGPFVFVTPRRWTGKTSWVTAKKAKSLWKDIRAYDASDIEQWLEQSLPAQAWFANETNIPAQHVRSLDRCWLDWASVSAPPLTGALFSSAIEATKRVMLSRLSKPPEKPVLIGCRLHRRGACLSCPTTERTRGGRACFIPRPRSGFRPASRPPTLGCGGADFHPRCVHTGGRTRTRPICEVDALNRHLPAQRYGRRVRHCSRTGQLRNLQPIT